MKIKGIKTNTSVLLFLVYKETVNAEIKIKNENNAWILNVKVEGMPLSAEIEIKQEIKAITFHQMNIEKIGNQYSTLIVFDI